MARVSDTRDQQDIERGTGSFLLPHSGEQDISTGCGSDRSGSGTDQSSLDPEQPNKPLILEKYIINGNKIPALQEGLSGDMKNGGQQWGNTTVNGGNSKNRKRKSVGIKTKLCCLIGGVTFTAGVVLIVVAVLMINNKLMACDSQSSLTANTGASVSSKNGGDNRGLVGVSDSHLVGKDGNHHFTSAQVKTNVPFTVTASTSTTTQPMTFDHLVNLAAGGQAYQSSTFRNEEGTIYPPMAAIDGSDLNKINSGSCSQTNAEESPVWWVDMGSFELVKRVRILQPSDCCGGTLSNFEIRIGQQKDLTTNVLCRVYMGTALTSMVDIQCQRQIYGRYVSIQLLYENKKPRKLSLCEVAIYDR